MICYLAGDIGGTKSRLQLFSVPNTQSLTTDSEAGEVLIYENEYPSQKYASLTFVIEKFLKEALAKAPAGSSPESLHPIACCLAVAGPVRANTAHITNVSWILDGAEMSKALNIPDVLIINDFVGVGYGLLALTRKDIIPINDVPLSEEAPKACLGAGTGLGEVYLTAGQFRPSAAEEAAKRRGGDDEERKEQSQQAEAEYTVWASEGGHADFAPRDSLEFGLLEFIKKQERVTRVSVERIVSGMGIPKIYQYFADLHPEEVSEEVTMRLRTEDKGEVIGEYAENGKCNLCRQAIELFVKIYGAEAGNLALKMLPFGGLYIAGGIAPKMLSFMLRRNLFFVNFVQKGQMQSILEKVPVFIVTHKSVGLLGAKVVCRRLLRKQGFLPGRGELASFTEATPHGSPLVLGENFSFPLMGEGHEGGYGDSLASVDKSYETEVTLEPTTHQPEKVVIRRRRNSAAAGGAGAGPKGNQQLKREALKYGIIGGTVASLLSVGALVALNYFAATRRSNASYRNV